MLPARTLLAFVSQQEPLQVIAERTQEHLLVACVT
jgi:hypothetical protein